MSRTSIEVVEAARALLNSGKSLCLVGPPGSGKTSLALRLAEDRGVEIRLVTGREDLSYQHLMGESGVLLDSLVASWARLYCGEPPVWVVFDEVNRARVETILGEFFTLLDLDHRPRLVVARGEGVAEKLRSYLEELGCRGAELVEHARRRGLPLPLSWRMIATMNLYDASHLFHVGYAFARRAPLLPVTGAQHQVEAGRLVEAEPRGRSVCTESIRRMLVELPRVARVEPWSLLPREAFARFEAPVAPLNPKPVAERVVSRSPFWGVVEEVAKRMEALGLLTGPALYVDACRLLAAHHSLKDPLALADVYVSSLLLPQLSYIVPRARLELALGRINLLKKFTDLAETVEKLLGPMSLSAWALRAHLSQLPIEPGQ